MLHTYLLFRAGTVGQIVVDVQSGLILTPTHNNNNDDDVDKGKNGKAIL
jgi:hypothetical protein